MKTKNPIPASATSTFNRNTIVFLINSALETKSYRFARQVATTWLNHYPGDLEVELLLAKNLIIEEKPGEAEAIINHICSIDPENLDAYRLLSEIVSGKDEDRIRFVNANIEALSGKHFVSGNVLDWGEKTWAAKRALQNNDMEMAKELILPVLKQNDISPIPALVHLQVASHKDDNESQKNLAEVYHAKWPECAAIKLLLADTLLRMGDDTGAVDILRKCAASDISGQIPNRIWGERHPYRLIWPDNLELKLDIQIPAEVARIIGWNQLIAGEEASTDEIKKAKRERITSLHQQEETILPAEDIATISLQNEEMTVSDPSDSQNSVSESAGKKNGRKKNDKRVLSKESPEVEEALKPINDAFRRISKKINRPEIGRMDGRFPMYILFSSKQGLINQYGLQTAEAIQQEMKKVSRTIRNRPGWGAMVFCPDDIDASLNLGITAINTIDPWQLKLSLHELDQALAKKGAMIGALLIVGGPSIIPFHHLPNPTEDSDKDVPSDNPYSTLDTNYFVPEWPVGRLPGEASADAGLLIEQLRRVNSYHNGDVQTIPWWQRFLFVLNSMKKSNKKVKKALRGGAMAYTAAAWRRSSVAVFRPLGKGESVLVSPPEFSGSLDSELFTGTQASYYNLHGLPDTPEWYGQKDVDDNSDTPDYPVALSVKDLIKNGKAPEIVFSEACYGGHIINKTEEQAILLRFVNIGVRAIIASSCIAYGSVNTPLIGADLLGYLFWKYTLEGMTTGEAFVKAKVETVREMTRRQGFLDGEDQKTLLSFILFGDPLIYFKETQAKKKSITREKGRPEIKTVNDRQDENSEPVYISKEVLQEVKTAVEQYLPGLDRASVTVGQEHVTVSEDEMESAVKNSGSKVKESQSEDGRLVVTFSKEVATTNHVHRHYARATVDKQGKVVKIALSR